MRNEIFDFSKLPQDEKIKLVGIIIPVIVACITGCFALMAAFVQRPASKVESNPTQVVLIINATAVPTFTPISAVTPTLSATTSIQPTSTITITAITIPTPAPELLENNKFSVPWSGWIINFVEIMPQATWIFLFISFGVVGLASAIMLFSGVQLNEYSKDRYKVRYVFASILTILVFVFSISKWGWWGVLWGFLFIISLNINHLFGGSVGAVIGTIVGVSISLFYLAIPGPLDGEIITSGSIIGCVAGIIVGAIFIKGSINNDKY